jgi:hypothetical protein
VIYYYLMADTQIWFMSVYDKDEAADLSGKEKRLLKAAIEWEIAQRSRRKLRKK